MMDLIDTHCHLCHGRLRQQLADVLERARQGGVRTIVCAAAEVGESQAAARLAETHDHIYCLAGVHPHVAKDAAGTDYLAEIERLARGPKCLAIGEIGLDYHYDFSPREQQRQVFAEQLALAGRLGARVVIHTREAFDDTLAVLADGPVPGERVIFHSFTHGPEEVERVLATGAAVSFGGIVTFARADDNRQAARLVPADRILVETDAPFLSPEPVRKQKTNEPANVVHTARFLAELRGEALEDFARQATANARRLLGVGDDNAGD